MYTFVGIMVGQRTVQISDLVYPIVCIVIPPPHQANLHTASTGFYGRLSMLKEKMLLFYCSVLTLFEHNGKHGCSVDFKVHDVN